MGGSIGSRLTWNDSLIHRSFLVFIGQTDDGDDEDDDDVEGDGDDGLDGDES